MNSYHHRDNNIPFICRRQYTDKICHAFEKSLKQNSQLLIVTGKAGVGKTALVHHTLRRLVNDHTYLIICKVSQHAQTTKFGLIADIVNQIIQYKLTESKQNVNAFTRALQNELSDCFDLLRTLAKAFKHLFKDSELMPIADPQRQINRLRNCLTRLLTIATVDNKQIIMFLDNLHWADSESLKLIDTLLTNLSTGQLFIIGTARISANIAQQHEDDYFSKLRHRAHIITLAEFDLSQTHHYVSQFLAQDDDLVYQLSKAIQLRTLGNPLHIAQLLNSVTQMTDSQRTPSTREILNQLKKIDNSFGALIKSRISHISPTALFVIEIAACIGYQFDLNVLIVAADVREHQVTQAVEELYKQCMITPSQSHPLKSSASSFSTIHYEFYHDEVHDYIYNSIHQKQRSKNHLKIARAFVSLYSDSIIPDEALFSIASHYNHVLDQTIPPSEIEMIIDYNYRAGQLAQSAATYSTALYYYQHAWRLQQQAPLTHTDDYTYDLQCGIIDCYSVVNHTLALQHIDALLQKSVEKQKNDQLIYKKMLIYAYQGQHLLLIDAGRQMLRPHGINIPLRRYFPTLFTEISTALYRFRKSNLATIFTSKANIQSRKITYFDILNLMSPAANLVDDSLAIIILLKLANLSAQHGTTAQSYTGYASLCVVLTNILKQYGKAQLIADKIQRFLAQTVDKRIVCQSSFILACFVDYYSVPLSETTKRLAHSYQVGMTSGDQLYGLYSYAAMTEQQYNCAYPLAQLYQRCLAFNRSSHNGKIETVDHSFSMTHSISAALTGAHDDLTFFNDKTALEQKLIALKTNDIVNLYLYRAQFFLYNNQISRAQKSIDQAIKKVATAKGFYFYFDVYYYYFIICCANYTNYNTFQALNKRLRLMSIYSQFKRLAQLGSTNFTHKMQLMRAEYLRITRRSSQAIKYYQLAIDNAHQTGFVQDQALACHLIAQCYAQLNDYQASQLYHQKAYACYEKWGARAVCQDYALRYNLSKSTQRVNRQTKNSTIHLNALNAASANPIEQFIKSIASQQASRQINDAFLRCICQLTSADCGYLLIETDDHLTVKAVFSKIVNADQSVIDSDMEQITDVAKTIIRYVGRTYQPIILNQLDRMTLFKDDPHLKRHANMSIICYPIFIKHVFLGLIYLECRQHKLEFSDELARQINTLVQHIDYADDPLLADQDTQTNTPLSKREMDVLQLIAMGKTGQTIADELFISLSTVKAHTKSIYRKLDVKRRVQAVIKAKKKGLIS